MNRWMIGARPLFFVFALQCLTHAQVPAQPQSHSRQPSPSAAGLQPQQRPPTSEEQSVLEKHLAATEGRLRQELEKQRSAIDQVLGHLDIEGRLTAIEKGVADLKRSSLLAVFLPAIIAALAGFGGVLLGGHINERLQRERLTQESKIADAKANHEKELATTKAAQERDLSEQQAKLQIGSAVVEWQLKQLSLLYGPVRALLGQSFGLYRQMNMVLERADDKRFKLALLDGAPDKQVFQIRTPQGTWERFRTVMHISQVYGQDLGVDTYFDEIVSIGARIVTIIEQYAGYARPEEKDLMTVFAKYLAHFAVLKHLHGQAKDSIAAGSLGSDDVFPAPTSAVRDLKVDLSAVFPEELHTLINDGFEAITRDIREWRRRAGA